MDRLNIYNELCTIKPVALRPKYPFTFLNEETYEKKKEEIKQVFKKTGGRVTVYTFS